MMGGAQTLPLGHHSKAEIEARGNVNYGWPHPSCLHFHQIVDSKVTKVQHQLPHQCHQMPERLGVLGIHTMADSPAGNLEAI